MQSHRPMCVPGAPLTCPIAPLGDHKEEDGARGLRCACRKTELMETRPEDLDLLLMRVVRCPGAGWRSETCRDMFIERPPSQGGSLRYVEGVLHLSLGPWSG